MAKYIPNRTFLVRQEDVEGGKKKDIIAHKGVPIELSDKEAVQFFGGLKLDDNQKKKLLNVARLQKYRRTI